MNIDFNSFFDVLIGKIDETKLSFTYYIISFFIVLLFFFIKDFILVKKKDRTNNTRQILSKLMIDVLAAWAICACCLYMVKNLLISFAFSVISTIYITNKLSEKSKKKDNCEDKDNSDNPSNVCVVVNNNVDTNGEKDENLLPDFYEPANLRLPDGVTSCNELNIIIILEMYGYISPNQKFKMITESLFETTDEQVEKLLKMYVLNEKELKEARAILNLIKLNNRLISKEEALQCILELENKQKKGGN